jgi:PadR family transcriptional regulator PadR
VYSLNTQGRDQLADFWRTWSFLAAHIEQLRHTDSISTTDTNEGA